MRSNTVMAILIPVTLYKTLLLVLPNQHVRAKVVSKNISERLSNESSTTDLYLTLEYQDGTQKTFAVGIKAFNSVAMNDEGTLVYR
ncbi:MAG: hypothetical protein CVU97_04225 [Firmicutes bacterium HGW-Firmicutes-21]|nr:MAG: hypothetical protein CVU97_04225 [Firmicutes bacterium HGW-Firmicutes-21]